MVSYRIDRRYPGADWECYDDNLTEPEAWREMQRIQDGRDDYAAEAWRMVRVEVIETVIDTIRPLPIKVENSP